MLAFVRHWLIIEVRNHYLDTPVHLSAFRGLVCSDGLKLAKSAHGDNPIRSYARSQQILAHRSSAVFRKLLIVVLRSDGISVPFDREMVRNLPQKTSDTTAPTTGKK